VSQKIGSPLFGHKTPAAKARELFKPSTDSASLLVDIENKILLFLVWRLLGGTSQVHFFGHLYLALGPNQLTHSFGSSFFRKLGKNLRLWSP